MARDISNYSLGGITINSADVRFNEPNKVYLNIQPGTVAVDYSEYLIINNLRAANSIVQMAPYTQLVAFKENIAPTISSITVNANGNNGNSNTLHISFSEPVINVLSNAFDIKINGEVARGIVVSPGNNNMEYTIAFPNKLNTTDNVTLSLTNNSLISDNAGNRLEQLTPYTVPVWY